MESKDEASQRVEELEKQIQSLTMELRSLKETLPPEAVAAVTPVSDGINDDDAKMVVITPEHLTWKRAVTGAVPAVPSIALSPKMLATEYCQKLHTSKPLETVTENQDFQICWNFVSAKGCTRRDCRWRHVDAARLYGTAQGGKQLLQKKRFTAKVSINDQSALGYGASKRTALNEAYRKLTESMDIAQKIAHIQLSKPPLMTMATSVKAAKTKLMEYAQKHKLKAPVFHFTSAVDASTNTMIWRVKSVFNGETVVEQGARKKNAEEKCCAQLLERHHS